MVEHPPDELERDVLEGERRAVEQLGEPQVRLDLAQRGAPRAIEAL
ncbi:MAG: hypothetical protein U5R31_03970 [Acidimicrobiia bacterium]|nr:hypothetical protein [Acidimicrobiia bacterium]